MIVVASIVAPLLLLRGRALRRWLACEIGAWLLLGAFSLFAKQLGVATTMPLLHGFFVLKLAMAFAFVGFARADDVRWSANRAALVALLLYAAAIPPMLQLPIDGDEPFYVLMTESIVRDHDLDLANQYRDLAHSAVRRTDLVPQLGDPVGPHGEQYSRHEPFFPILLVPGYAVAGLPGCVAIVAIFGALLARSTIRLFEDEGISDATARALFPLIAFGPPIVFYAVRIWPEVPAAFCFVEAVRGIRQRRAMRWLQALCALVLLKIRFGLIAVALLVRVLPRWRRERLPARWIVAAAAFLIVPLIIVFVLSGRLLGTHYAWELLPGSPHAYLLGFFGLLLDAAAGIAFQAPIYLFALVAVGRWPKMPAGFRVGMSGALLYIFFLAPRPEWHGGWSPPLRYVVVFFPILALGVAALWERIAAGPLLAATAWTIGLVIHGFAYPWRLFHIANGEAPLGEWLSETLHSDFSRMLPSFIRHNEAGFIAVLLLLVFIAVFRDGRTFTPAVAALLVAAFVAFGLRPGRRIEFEDVHVTHRGGQLYPPEYTVSRFLYEGGWIVHAGDSLSFLARGGRSQLRYQSPSGASISIAGRTYALSATGAAYADAAVDLPRDGRVELRCLGGSANLDRMTHE